MAHKFIITTDATITETIYDEYKIRMANVQYHNDLLPKDFTGRVKGGGYFHVDKSKNSLYLYGKSEEFGYAKKDHVIDAISRTYLGERMIGYMCFISHAESLQEAILLAEDSTPDYLNQ